MVVLEVVMAWWWHVKSAQTATHTRRREEKEGLMILMPRSFALTTHFSPAQPPHTDTPHRKEHATSITLTSA
jgi:hypothetical protein